ncbi:MAG TPA: glycosyltransferase family 2 protein [Polyangia bacterium]|nr:glycosyltransferase family 2 protein [Polyangia bacterium]
MPRVSVILNSYNQGRFLAETIESVLAQTYGDFELLLIDNGSTDDSQELARRYAAEDARIKLSLHPANVSLSARQNEGVRAAQGELVSFLYSDDLYLPHKLERQVAMLDRLGPDVAVVYAPALGFNILTGQRWQHPCLAASGMVLRDIMSPHPRGGIDMLSPLTRAEALRRYPFHEDLFAEGEAIYHRLAMRYRFHFDEEPVVVLREHDRNIGKAIRRNHENYMLMLDRMEQHPDFPDELRPLLPAFRARLMLNAAWQTVRMDSDDMRWARRRFTLAVGADRGTALHPKTLVGLGLTLLPRSLRRRVNRLGTTLRSQPANAVYREGY